MWRKIEHYGGPVEAALTYCFEESSLFQSHLFENKSLSINVISYLFRLKIEPVIVCQVKSNYVQIVSIHKFL